MAWLYSILLLLVSSATKLEGSVLSFLENVKHCILQNCAADQKQREAIESWMGNSCAPIENDDTYDMVFETGSFKELACEGWNITRGTSLNEHALKNPSKIVSVYGPFDVGKTYLLSKLSGKTPISGVCHITKGISVLQEPRDKTVFLDTVGYGRAAIAVDEAEVVEDFLQQVAVETANVILFIVGPLTRYDQEKFSTMLKRLSHLPGGCREKTIIFVHNFKDYFYEEEVALHIKTDIVEAFRSEQGNDTTTGATYYKSTRQHQQECPGVHNETNQECLVTHIVLAKEGSPAGTVWNENSMKFLKSILVKPAATEGLIEAIRKAAEKVAAENFMLAPPLERPEGKFDFLFEERAVLTAGVDAGGASFVWGYVTQAIRKLINRVSVNPLKTFHVSISDTKMKLQLDTEAESCGKLVPRHKSFRFVPNFSTWEPPGQCSFFALVELPGVAQTQVQVVHVTKTSTLLVSGYKDHPSKMMKDCSLSDCPTSSIGPFSLLISVPQGMNFGAVKYWLVDGLLQIEVPSFDPDCSNKTEL